MDYFDAKNYAQKAPRMVKLATICRMRPLQNASVAGVWNTRRWYTDFILVNVIDSMKLNVTRTFMY